MTGQNLIIVDWLTTMIGPHVTFMCQLIVSNPISCLLVGKNKTLILLDAPASFLMDSTSNPKVKTTKGYAIGACSLTRNTSRVKGHAGIPGWD